MSWFEKTNAFQKQKTSLKKNLKTFWNQAYFPPSFASENNSHIQLPNLNTLVYPDSKYILSYFYTAAEKKITQLHWAYNGCQIALFCLLLKYDSWPSAPRMTKKSKKMDNIN